MNATKDAVLPHDLAAERACLDVALFGWADRGIATIVDILAPHHFYDPGHSLIYSAAAAIHGRGEPVDPVTVARELGVYLDEVGGRDALMALAGAAPTYGSAQHYADAVVACWERREWILIAQELAANARDGISQDQALDRLTALRRPQSKSTTDHGPIAWPEFWTRERPTDVWICEPLIPRARATHLYAARGAGKSTLMFYVACCLAAGRPTLDRPAGPGLTVAYVDRENGADDIEDHLHEFGFGPADDLSRLHYWIDPPFAHLDTSEGATRLLAWIDDIKPDVVFIDSITRCMVGEENSNDAYDDIYEYTIAPLKRRGIASIWAGNTGKDREKGSRGGSRKEDIMDAVWSLHKGDEGLVKLHLTKNRPGFLPERAELQRVENADGTIAYTTANPAAHLPAGSTEVARLLDQLHAPAEITYRDAGKLLRDNGHGRRNEVVRGALKYRSWHAQNNGAQAGAQARRRNGAQAGAQGA